MVRKLAKRAADRLDLVRDTFPTYTLHNRTHSKNVVELMGELLGPTLGKITPLEGALLILSAYCHDIGMVFDEEERRNISAEENYSRFLSTYPEARIAVQQAGGVPIDVAEWYCRWIHPDRVHRFLKRLRKEESAWNDISIREKLGAVCQSHGYDASLLIDDKFATDFLGEADLRFCAVLLRLADILDFDNTRTPDEVYRYLGLGKRDNPRTQTSDVEWRKHLAAGGFRFPVDRDGQYPLKFVANPDHPAVEYDVRQFLNVIESEIQKCHSVLKYCSTRWRDFDLPMSINRDDIVSSGYKYGEYRFTLEQNRILELLMGDDLYEDAYVFIRELLQNAIDTTRHRLYFERSKGVLDYEPRPITVASWFDRDNYQWVRIDDYGMGMSEDIIVRYFLRIGESYYHSPQFQAEILQYKKINAPPFVPISRFGIGVLSCFIVGDRVEVTTRYIGDSKSKPVSIRLSLSGLHSFYVLQRQDDEHYDAADMPGKTRAEQGSYRMPNDFGTSVAIRLNPQKEKAKLDLKEALNRYVLFPPVPVSYEGELIGGDSKGLVDTPWINGPVEEQLTQGEIAKLEYVFGFKFKKPPVFRMVPLDLTKYSPTPNLRGQGLIGWVFIDDSDAKSFESLNRGSVRTDLSTFLEEKKGELPIPLIQADFQDEQKSIGSRRFHPGAHDSQTAERDARRRESIDISRALSKLSEPVSNSPRYSVDTKSRWLSHNGICVPITYGSRYSKAELHLGEGGRYWIRQVVALSDGLRPAVSLSRDQLKDLSWNIYSAIALALLKSLAPYKSLNVPLNLNASDLFSTVLGREQFLLGQILADPFFGLEGEWAAQEIIQTNVGPRSLHFIRGALGQGLSFQIVNIVSPDQFLKESYGFNFLNACAAALMQIALNPYLKVEGYYSKIMVDSTSDSIAYRGQHLFPPLFFLPYKNTRVLKRAGQPLNQKHDFSQWLIEHAEDIHEKYPGMFKSIRESLSEDTTYFREKSEARLQLLNTVLDRLWDLEEAWRPPKRLRLKKEDFSEEY